MPVTEPSQTAFGPLIKEECPSSLKTMASDKTPGTDDLPAEFYKVFWDDIEAYLLNAMNGSHEKRCLSISQRRGLITLLPSPPPQKNKQTNKQAG